MFEQVVIFEEMLGKTFDTIHLNREEVKELILDTPKGSLDEITLYSKSDRLKVMFYHEQNCCETVYIEDIEGDLRDLTGSPITTAESYTKEADAEYVYDSGTYTFYRFATQKGSVTIRWLGESNGYYSENVTCEICSLDKDGHKLETLKEY